MVKECVAASKVYFDFCRAHADGMLAHAYLVVCPDKEVRYVLAELMAENILCKAGGCGKCDVCTRIEAGTYIDIKWYNQDSKMATKDAESLIDEAYKKGWMNDLRLFFLDNAESLSPAVQNKLLKVYEEPPEGAIIMLMAGSDAGILQTINSRAKKIYVPLFPTKVICDELIEEGVPKKLAETAAVFADGRFDKAHLYSGDENYVKLYDRVFEILLGCKKSADIVDYINDFAFSKENIGTTLELMEIILRDVMGIACKDGGRRKTVNRDYDLGKIAEGFSAGGAAMSIYAVTEAVKRLESNLAAVTVAEKLLFDILEAKYKWQ